MILHNLDRSSFHNSSFTARKNEHAHFLKIWHHHKELELVFIVKSHGTCFLGDSIQPFEEGDIYLVGEDLPHMWLNDDAYFQLESDLKAKAIAVHFKKDFLGKVFFESPEMIHLLELMERARYGIRFRNVGSSLKKSFNTMLELEGFAKTMSFLNILDTLSKHKNYHLLVSHGYVSESPVANDKKLNEVYAHIFNNFKRRISLEEVSQIAHMHTSAFSRLFKQVNHKTFSRYLSEIRIGYACKLLLEGKNNIATVCYESGFQNISNFNRQFKLIKNCTPTTYVNERRVIQNKQ